MSRIISEFDKEVMRFLAQSTAFNFTPEDLVSRFAANDSYVLIEDVTPPANINNHGAPVNRFRDFKTLIGSPSTARREAVLTVLFNLHNLMKFLIAENLIERESTRVFSRLEKNVHLSQTYRQVWVMNTHSRNAFYELFFETFKVTGALIELVNANFLNQDQKTSQLANRIAGGALVVSIVAAIISCVALKCS